MPAISALPSLPGSMPRMRPPSSFSKRAMSLKDLSPASKRYSGTASVYLAPVRLGRSNTWICPALTKGSIIGVMLGFQ